jgi:hypothetical protein
MIAAQLEVAQRDARIRRVLRYVRCGHREHGARRPKRKLLVCGNIATAAIEGQSADFRIARDKRVDRDRHETRFQTSEAPVEGRRLTEVQLWSISDFVIGAKKNRGKPACVNSS